LLTLVAYEKWLLSLPKIEEEKKYDSLNIVESQCCYQTIKEQCIYNSHKVWWQLAFYRILKYFFIVTMVAMFDGGWGPQP
jgi:hypothetical protein